VALTQAVPASVPGMLIFEPQACGLAIGIDQPLEGESVLSADDRLGAALGLTEVCA
jgi:hypothetical protein